MVRYQSHRDTVAADVKTFTVQQAADYAARERTVATFWQVTRVDGEVFGFTNHDISKLIGGVQYEASAGFNASELATNATLSVDNMEVTGLFDSAGITDAELEAGVWDNAEIIIFEANYVSLAWTNTLLTGWLGQVRRNRGLFVAELRSLTTKVQKSVGALLTPNCRYKLGDLNCQVDLDALTQFDVPVTAITSRRVFTAASLDSMSPPIPSGFFNWGVLTFTTGLNAGFRMDVKSYAAGVIELQLAFPYAVAVADEFSISPGCNKQFKTAPGVYDGDCFTKYDNAINFGGEPEVPLAAKSARVPGT